MNSNNNQPTNYPLIPMSEIRPEIRKIAIAWHENATNWIGDKHKLASDIQNYADRWANRPVEVTKSVEEAAENWLEEQGGATAVVAPDFIKSFLAGHAHRDQEVKDRDKEIKELMNENEKLKAYIISMEGNPI